MFSRESSNSTSSLTCARNRAFLCALPLVLIAGCGSDEIAVPPAPTTEPAVSSSAAPSTTAPPPSTSFSPTVTPTTTTTSKPPAVRKTSPLTGGKVIDGPVLAVKIDNTSAGRPQFGLAAADIVYVEQVEAGLTRLVAVFQSTLPTEVGPVRSVRSTDVELLQAYGSPGLVFSGGAGGPMSLLAESPLINLSEDSLPQYFWRSDAASAPYNLHADLTKIAETEGEVSPTRPIGFSFAEKDARVAAAPKATKISVEMLTKVQFSYAPVGYQLIHDDEPYDDAGGDPVVADNVLLQNVINEPDGTVDSAGSPSYETHTVGTGTFTLFRDGHAVSGTWKREDADSATTFLDEKGKAVFFKPGKTWVLLAPQNSTVNFS